MKSIKQYILLKENKACFKEYQLFSKYIVTQNKHIPQFIAVILL